jgi:hypothetical protein
MKHFSATVTQAGQSPIVSKVEPSTAHLLDKGLSAAIRGILMESTMNAMKTVMLTALASLPLLVGTAMAQSEVPSFAEGSYFSGQPRVAQKSVADQAGSSDLTTMHSRTAPVHYDYSTLANPG